MACSPSPSPLYAAASPHGFQRPHPLITSLASRGRCAPPGLCGQTFHEQRATGPLGGSPVSCPSHRCWCLDAVTQCLLSSWWLLAARGVVWHQLPITTTSCSPSFMKGVCLSAEQTFAASCCELYTLCCCQVWAVCPSAPWSPGWALTLSSAGSRGFLASHSFGVSHVHSTHLALTLESSQKSVEYIFIPFQRNTGQMLGNDYTWVGRGSEVVLSAPQWVSDNLRRMRLTVVSSTQMTKMSRSVNFTPVSFAAVLYFC